MKKKILYVDDEEINLRMFKTSFRRDFEVFTALSAEEGLKILDDEHIDLVLTDQMMPHMTGVEFLERVNRKYPHIPPTRLIISGYAKNEDIDKAYEEYRLFQFIAKPWKKDDLLTTINQALNEGE